MYQSHTGRLTGLWFLPKPAFGLNTNDDDDFWTARHVTWNIHHLGVLTIRRLWTTPINLLLLYYKYVYCPYRRLLNGRAIKKQRIGVHKMLHYRSVWSRLTQNPFRRFAHACVRHASPLLPSPPVGRGTGVVTKLFKEVVMPSLRQFCK